MVEETLSGSLDYAPIIFLKNECKAALRSG